MAILSPACCAAYLVVANFHSGLIEPYTQSFASLAPPGSFTDPGLPAGFDLKGNFVERYAQGGSLNSPWGVVLASANFGAFSNDILIGNFGDGTINAFDPAAGDPSAVTPGAGAVTSMLTAVAAVRRIVEPHRLDEVASSWRYRQIIENNGCALSAFDQDEWARLGNYASWKPEDSLQLFRLLREANLRMFSQFTADEWNRFGLHAERGKVSVRDLIRHMAGHDMNHLDQIRAILAMS